MLKDLFFWYGVYFVIINILTFAAFGLDKSRAVRGKRRISEANLLTFCFIGGSLFGLAAMFIFHHKTKKPKFRLLVPIFLVLNILIFFVLKTPFFVDLV